MTRATLRAAVSDDVGDALLHRIGGGDGAALGLAFDHYHRDVYAFLARLRGARHDLDDLVQATFLALPAAAARYDSRGAARAFVLGVAFQVARRERRRVFRRFALWVAREGEVDAPSAPLDPEQSALDRESMQALERALAKLPAAQRETFVLVEVEGLKGEEAAQILSVPLNTVWTRLHHARLALRATLRGRGAP
jgi:RNA polymerase sigma-70 factor (ECF subfamily)